MNLERVAFISFHACPIASPGQGKSGGMNVYVQQLARSLGELGVAVDIYTRQHAGADGKVEEISAGVRVVHIPGGDPNTPMEDLFTKLPGFLESVRLYRQQTNLTYAVVHSHYWL
ncbi:MAG: glycosyltransferase, partial [Chloroflexi bacterium]|nr:glycosyltransferase [Chloroflexota bacterium]